MIKFYCIKQFYLFNCAKRPDSNTNSMEYLAIQKMMALNHASKKDIMASLYAIVLNLCTALLIWRVVRVHKKRHFLVNMYAISAISRNFHNSMQINIITNSASVNLLICEGLRFVIYPKLYKNIESVDVLLVMRRLYNDISDEHISIDDRNIVLKMISACESYFSGNIPHKKFMKIIQLYEGKGLDKMAKMLEIYDKYIMNTSISSICSLYNNIKDESLKEHLYNLVLYVTNNEYVAKYICDHPQIMVLDDINYDIPHFYNSAKKLLDAIINFDDNHINNIPKAIDHMNKLCSYVRHSYNR